MSGGAADWPLWRWEKPVGASIRFYEARLQPDLWGDWTVILVWGQRGSALGRVVFTPVADYVAGLYLVEQVSLRRQRRGYAPVGDVPGG